MMDAGKGAKWAAEWNRFNLQIVGVWPDPSASDIGIGKYRFLLTALLAITFLIGPQSANLILIWGDVDLMTEILATADIPILNALIKLLFTWYHRNALRLLLSSFYEDWHREKMADELSTMMKNALIARKISIGLNVFTQTTLMMYVLPRLAEIIMTKDRTNIDPMRCTMYISAFPFDNCKSPMLEVICLGQTVAVILIAITYTGIDSFICMLIFHACGQYANLGEAIRRLFDENIETKYQKDISRKLGAIVKRHNHLNRFSSTIEESFNVLLLIQMLGSTVQLCFQCFQVLKDITEKGDVPTYLLMFLGLYVIFIALHLYLYCYVGEMLVAHSSAIGYSAYESRWYNAHPGETKDLLLVMNRSMKPLCLTAGKFSMFCLETFSSVIRTSIGYLSVLIAVSATAE